MKDYTTIEKSETNDCVVRSLAAVTGSEYMDAWKFCADKLNRGFKKGVMMNLLTSMLSKEGAEIGGTHFMFERCKTRSKTVGKLARNAKTGSYFVLVSGHALAIVNNELIDAQNKPLARIKYVFKVTKSYKIIDPWKTTEHVSV